MNKYFNISYSINLLLIKFYKWKIDNFLKKNSIDFIVSHYDENFDYRYGKLQWRSLDFKFKTIKKEFFQRYVQINFPNEKNYTRRVEIKHVTKQKSKFTTLSYEYPNSYGDPYYPINNDKNKKIFSKYKKLIKISEKENIFFEGRLAQYKYLNMDEVIEKALLLFYKLKKKYS